jgi:sugar lactone lactonase YvrE
MLFIKSGYNNQKGFILIGLLFTMVILAVIALSMNQRAGMQAKMAANQTRSIQANFGQLACIENGLWKLNQEPNWRTGRYTDLTFVNGGGGANDTIVTAGCDFVGAGFAAGDEVAILYSAPANDGIHTLLSTTANSLAVANGSLSPGGAGLGSAIIRALSGAKKTYPLLTFSTGSNCGNDKITRSTGDFSTDGFARGDQIAVVDSSHSNDGIYTILAVSEAGTTIELTNGSLNPGTSGTATMAVLRGQRYDYQGVSYEQTVRDTFICGSGSFINLSCAPHGGLNALTDLIRLRTWRDFFIADTYNHRIRKVDAGADIITTVAGNSTEESLLKPQDVHVDLSGNIYIADTQKHCIRKIDAITGAVSVIAGNGSAGYSGDGGPATEAMLKNPWGVSTDAYGNVYIADTQNFRIRRVDAVTGVIATVAGNGLRGYSGDGGPATLAQIEMSFDVFADGDGNLYIADTDNHRIRRVDAATGIITTVAGNGSGGYWGDAEPATRIKMAAPLGVKVDAAGNIYIVDTENHRIRKVAVEVNAETGFRLVTTIAGNGSAGYSGDGGPATEAMLKNPHDILLDSAGNIYIADTDNHRIRRVDAASGMITTVAGNGDGGYIGDDVPATSTRLNKPRGVYLDAVGSIYIADTDNDRIRQVDAVTNIITTVAGNGAGGYSGDDVSATSTRLNHPQSVFADATGNIYIADTDNHRIRRVAAATKIITTVAGNGDGGYTGDGVPATSTRLNKPKSVFVDTSGNIHIADTDNKRIRRIDAVTNVITTVAGNGEGGYSGDGVPATDTQLNKPQGTFVDTSGNIWIADTDNHRIRRVDAATDIITTAAGNGIDGYWGDADPANRAKLNDPKGVHVDAIGNIYIADTTNHRIRKVHAEAGVITTVAGNGVKGTLGDGGPAALAQLDNPNGVYVDENGNIYLADTENHRIRSVDAITGMITTVAGTGDAGYLGDGGLATDASIKTPGGVHVDAYGNIIIADTDNNCIREVYDATGLISTIAGEVSGGYVGDGLPAVNTKLNEPGNLTLDADGNIYIADTMNNRIRTVDADSGFIETIAGNGERNYSGDGGPATDAMLNEPQGICLDASGNLFIADTGNHRIRRVEAETGVITTVAGNGTGGYEEDGVAATATKLNKPQSVYVDAAGNIYIADTENSRIRKVDAATEIITTVAGSGDRGYSGDGGPATAARLKKPYGVWVDGTGNLFIADTENHRVRKVDAVSGIITTVAGNGSRGDEGDNDPATEAELDAPTGISVDADGNIYIADTKNHRIRMVDAVTGNITKVAGGSEAGFAGDGGPPDKAKFSTPRSVWVDPFATGGSFLARP